MPCTLHLPASVGGAEKEAALAGVSIYLQVLNHAELTPVIRFMADKIMPLSEAVEGYEIFDKMKAQKVIFEAGK